MLTWAGSIVSLLSTLISIVSVGPSESWLIGLIDAFYLVGLQGITIADHILLNKHIQKVRIEDLPYRSLTEELLLETKLNYFKNILTVIPISVRILLLASLSLG